MAITRRRLCSTAVASSKADRKRCRDCRQRNVEHVVAHVGEGGTKYRSSDDRLSGSGTQANTRGIGGRARDAISFDHGATCMQVKDRADQCKSLAATSYLLGVQGPQPSIEAFRRVWPLRFELGCDFGSPCL